MHHPFLPLLLLVLVPAAYAGLRLGWINHAAYRGGLALAVAAIVAISAWAGGVDYVFLNRVKLLLALATIGVLLLHQFGALGMGDHLLYRRALGTLAVLAVTVYLNFFGFHAVAPQRTYIHLHDVAHYYLGAKYARELAYADLYAAIVRAEAESSDPPSLERRARDLRGNRLVNAIVLLEDSAPVRAGFSTDRWEAFTRDVAWFRTAMGAQFADILVDHGYNPPPLWTLIGGTLANLVPAGSGAGIFLLTLIDPLLLGLAVVLLWRTAGAETALLAVIYCCVLFGASFGWVGGAFMRFLWLFAIIAAVCAVERARVAAGGAWLALAAVLRIFPALLAVALGLALAAHTAGGSTRRRVAAAAAAGVLTAALLVALTALAPNGLGDWRHFTDNMQRHMQNTAFNTIGLDRIIGAVSQSVVPTTDPGIAAARQRWLYLAQLLIGVPLVSLWIVRRARATDGRDALAMGVVLLYVSLNLACYYYLVLVVVLVAVRHRPEALVVLFGVEAATYALLLVEDRDALIFLYRNVLVLLLLLGVFGGRTAVSSAVRLRR
jgi:hypothetical protein